MSMRLMRSFGKNHLLMYLYTMREPCTKRTPNSRTERVVAFDQIIRAACVVTPTLRLKQNQKILSFLRLPRNPPPKKGEARSFWFCFAALSSEMGIVILSLWGAHFSVFAARQGASVSALCGNSQYRSHAQPPPHSPLASSRRLLLLRRCA